MAKIDVLITARPTYTRVKPLLQLLSSNSSFETTITLAASALEDKFGNIAEIANSDGWIVRSKISSQMESDSQLSMSQITAETLRGLGSSWSTNKPDLVIVNGDRFETVAGTLAASHLGIPVGHIMGGERSGNIDDAIRDANSSLATLHFTATAKATANLRSWVRFPDNVFHTGCPSIDICAQLEKQIDIVALQESISRVGVGTEIDLSEPFMIIMQHPVTDHFKEIDSEIMETFYAVSEIKMQKIWFWPNADIGTNIASKTLRRIRENNELDGFRFIKTLPPHTFLRLLSLSAVIVGNSSAGIREGSYLGVPCVNIGDRQIGRETAENVNHCSSNSLQIQKAIELHLDSGKFKSSVLYGDGSAAIKIVHAIESFFEYN